MNSDIKFAPPRVRPWWRMPIDRHRVPVKHSSLFIKHNFKRKLYVYGGINNNNKVWTVRLVSMYMHNWSNQVQRYMTETIQQRRQDKPMRYWKPWERAEKTGICKRKKMFQSQLRKQPARFHILMHSREAAIHTNQKRERKKKAQLNTRHSKKKDTRKCKPQILYVADPNAEYLVCKDIRKRRWKTLET